MSTEIASKSSEPVLRESISGGVSKSEILRLYRDEKTRDEIARLFLEEDLTPRQIEEHMNGSLQMPATLRQRTRIRVIREVINIAVPEEERLKADEKINQKLRKGQVTSDTIKKLELVKRKLGQLVFSDIELEYFLKIREQKRMEHPRGCDNEKLAQAMRDRFNTDKFTALKCRSKGEKLKKQRGVQLKRDHAPIEETKSESGTETTHHVLEMELFWLLMNAELETIEINQDILFGVYDTIEKFLKKRDWESIIGIILATHTKYSPEIGHVMDFILGCSYLEIGNIYEAGIAFELCSRASGPMTARITYVRTMILRSQTSSNIFSQLNDPIAVPPLVVVPPKDLGEVLSLDHGESRINNTAVTVSDNVVGDDGAVLDAENSF
jgi:hypothetical protein